MKEPGAVIEQRSLQMERQGYSPTYIRAAEEAGETGYCTWCPSCGITSMMRDARLLERGESVFRCLRCGQRLEVR